MESLQSMMGQTARPSSRNRRFVSKDALIISNPVIALARATLVVLMTAVAFMLIQYIQNALHEDCSVESTEANQETLLEEEEKCARLRRRNTLIEVTLAFLRVLVIMVGTLLALWQLGVQSGALFTFAGIVSLVIGLAAQQTLRDIMSGLVVLMEKQMSVGDIVELTLVGGMNHIQGTVDHMTLRMLQIRTFDNSLVYVPQSQVLSVTNLSQKLPVVRMRIKVSRSVEYKTLDDALEKIIVDLKADETFSEMIPDETSDTTQNVLASIGASTPFPTVLGIDKDSDNGYEVMLRFVTRFNQQWSARRYAHAYIMNGLYHEGISTITHHVKMIEDKSKSNKEN